MPRKKKRIVSVKVSQPTVSHCPPLSSIGQYLDRMSADVEEVKKRLLDAPADLTGSEEPKLFNLIEDIRTKLVAAKAI